MISLGIDLGKAGALVALKDDGALLAWARTPVVGKAPVRYNGPAMHDRLEDVLEACKGTPARAFIEHPNVMKLFAPAAFAVGEGFGRWTQALDSLSISWRTVPAATWVRLYLPAPKRVPRDPSLPPETREQADARRKARRLANKDALLLHARRLCPTAVPWDQLNKESRSGVADALLLAEWGRTRG